MDKNRMMMGAAFSLAAVLVAIDHTRHPLPPAVTRESPRVMPEESATTEVIIIDSAESPCTLGNPCGLRVSPCSLD